MENQNDTAENQQVSENIIPETSNNKTKTWIYRIACILLFVAGVVFFIYFFHPTSQSIILNYMNFIILSVIVAMVTIFLCFKTGIKVTAFKIAALITAGIVLAINWFIYFRYIPKYELSDACAIVKADPKYSSATVEPQYRLPPSKQQLLLYYIKDNPFCNMGYLLDVISDGKVIACIAFDTATGKYYVFYEPKD